VAHEAAGWLLGLALRSAVLFVLALALVGLVRRWSAEERHLVLIAAMLGVLVLPAVGPLLTAVGVPPVVVALPGAARAGGESAVRAGGPAVSVAAGGGAAADRAPGRSAPAAAAAEGVDAAPRDPGPPTRLVAAVGAVYASVAVLMLAAFAASAWRISRRLRRARPMRDAESRRVAEAVAADLGIASRVRWLVDDAGPTPWAWGLLQPTVVVPADFAAWTAAEKRSAVVHELAHIARRDTLSTLLAYLCCALCWFQPLAWIAMRRLKREAELACDDRVLLAGCERTAYAGQLLTLANAIFRKGGSHPFIPAMAGASPVARRIRAILDERMRRNTVSKLKLTIAVSTALALVVPLAALRSQESPSGDPMNDPAFQALLAAGPADDGELTRIVETLLDGGASAQAKRVLVEWLTSEAASAVQCSVCVRGLRDESGRTRPRAMPTAVVAAFDAVEAEAQAQADAGLLVRLADISLASRSRPAIDRGLSYLLQAEVLGGTDSSARRQTTMRYLLELGQYDKARALAQQIYDDPDSRLYHDESMQQWMKYIELERARIVRLSATLVSTEDGIVSAEGDYLPLYKVAPAYPEEAAELGREGRVVVEYTVGKTGQTSDVKVYDSSDSLFDEAAVASARAYRYAPRIEGGVPVEVPGVRTKITFRLAR
jgi:TonB family protein